MATVVVELGDSLIRVGLGGESAPRFISPASTYPTSGKTPGEIRQYFTEIFHAFFIENLQIKSKEHRVLVIEKFFTPRIIRNSLLTSLLKDLQVRSQFYNHGIGNYTITIAENHTIMIIEVICYYQCRKTSTLLLSGSIFISTFIFIFLFFIFPLLFYFYS